LREFVIVSWGSCFNRIILLPQCTVIENVLVPTLPLADTELRDSALSRARQLLEKVGLGNRLGHRPGQLSGGERQRVAVVRALINRPKLVLADEPTGALDRVSATSLGDLLVRLNVDEGVSLIVVTHALDLAKRLQKVFELKDGALHELVDSH
jgi:lipoprotein-releasing system ATP-binding protein